VIYGRLGDWARGFDLVRRALDLSQGIPSSQSIALALLTWLYTLKGEFDQAEAALHSSYEFTRATDNTDAPIFSVFAEGELALAKQEYARALRAGAELLAAPLQTGARPFRSDALWIRGRAKWGQHETEEALTILTEARAAAEALGSRRILWEILAAMSDIEAQRGNHAAAQTFRAQARTVLEYIVAHISTAELRASFLNLPKVQHVMREQ
jgi:ATP/maltotriose-dependent transcriptional regulator MalT